MRRGFGDVPLPVASLICRYGTAIMEMPEKAGLMTGHVNFENVDKVLGGRR
jgi:hypothetical protein